MMVNEKRASSLITYSVKRIEVQLTVKKSVIARAIAAQFIIVLIGGGGGAGYNLHANTSL